MFAPRSIGAAMRQLMLVSAGFMLALVAVFLIANSASARVESQASTARSLGGLLNQIESHLLQWRNDHMRFVSAPSEEGLVAHHADDAALRASIAEAQEINMPAAAPLFETLIAQLDGYQQSFETYAHAVERLGFSEDQGLQGGLRTAVHDIEDRLAGFDAPRLQVKMLMMRRHEKDFIMRGKPKYLTRLDTRVDEFRAYPPSIYPSFEEYQAVMTDLDAYQSQFHAYVETALQISDFEAQMNAKFDGILPALEALQSTISDQIAQLHAQNKATQSQFTKITAGAVLLALLCFGWVSMRASRRLSRPLGAAADSISHLADGALDVTLPRSSLTEVQSIGSALESFRDKIRANKQMQEELAAADEERQLAEQERAEMERANAAEKERAAQAELAAERDRRAAEQQARDAQQAAERVRQAEAEEARAAKQRADEAAAEEAEMHMRDQVAVVTQIARGLSELSKGNLTCSINAELPGQGEQLRHDFNAAVQGLGQTLQGVVGAATGIGTGINAVRATTQDLTRDLETNAAAIEETAAAMEQLTSTVKEMASSSEEISSLSGKARSDVENSDRLVRDVVSAMESIEESSSEISKIIKLIDDISFQTNLLALNAGVEAARAGDAGRGFAVVASEVGILAQRSTKAASEISALIQKGATEVGNGVSLVADTRTALGEALTSVRDISIQIESISVSSREQASAITDVNGAISAIDASTQKSTGKFEEILAATEHLSNESQGLTEAVERFDLPISNLEDYDRSAA